MAETNGQRLGDRSRSGRRHLSGYLSVREAAEVLNMHFMSVYKLVQTGRLPALKIGHRWKIDPGELDHWIARHRADSHHWMLVGATAARAERLRSLLGPEHRLDSVNFDAIAEALQARPDVVMIDSTVDRHAALAALAICRRGPEPPFTVLLVAEPERETLADALEQGLVTLMPLPATGAMVEQIGAILHWT